MVHDVESLVKEAPCLVNALDLAAQAYYLGVLPEIGHLHLEPVGQGHVVSVHPRDELATGQQQPLVQGRHQSPIRSADEVDPRILFGIPLEDLGRAVGRAVVDDQELEVGLRLRQNALDGLGHVTLRVVDRH